MSQPAVSQAIARLERSFGLRLFERTSREVQLSDAGKVLLPYAEALMDQAAAFTAEAARLAEPTRAAIRLAYPPLVGALAARVVRRLARRVPAIDVVLRAGGWSAATADVTQGTAAAAIMSAPFPTGYATTARFHVPVTHLAVPAGSRLATAASLRPEQLRHFDILVARHRPVGGMWAQLVSRLHGSRIVAEEIDDPSAALDLVAAGRGLLPTPRLLVETVRRHDVHFVPVNLGNLRITYGLVWSTERVSAELMALVQAVQEVLRGR